MTIQQSTGSVNDLEPSGNWQGLTHWGWDKMAAISQMTFSNAFSLMKMYEFRLRFHWSLFLRFELTIIQQWLVTCSAPSHYLNQCCLVYWRIYASLGFNELIQHKLVQGILHQDYIVKYTSFILESYMIAYIYSTLNKDIWVYKNICGYKTNSRFIMHGPGQTTDIGECLVNCLDWTCVILSLIFMSVIWISQPMEWLHCCLCYCSLWHHNAATIAPVTSQWDTHWSALSNQNAALLVLQSYKNPHDINWIKLEFLMLKIIISTH